VIRIPWIYAAKAEDEINGSNIPEINS